MIEKIKLTNESLVGISLNNYSIEYYIGEKRSGKTLSIVKDTHEDLVNFQKKFNIFTNFHLTKEFIKDTKLTMENIKLITINDLAMYFENKEEFTNSFFLIDELQTWLDNRNFMKAKIIKDKVTGEKRKINVNQTITYFFGQMGKRGNILRGTLHDYDMTDIRGRRYSEKLNYIFKGLIDDKGKWKPLLNYNRKLTKEENERLYIQKIAYIKKLVKTKTFLPEFRYVKLNPEYIKADLYFKMYDTYELI